MCGIAGLVSKRVCNDPFLESLLARWHALLRHRGPDGWGWYRCVQHPVLLFHSRLAVTGVQNGQQPIPNEDRSIWLSFNGEIYNHRALRMELEASGHHFSSASDGEVIVHLYEKEGIQGIQRLRGEFAFALYDANVAKVYLVRDRFGIKPLYYAQHEDGLHFGSEIKAIFADSAFPRRFDPVTVQNYLHTFYFDTETVFEGISQVPPGGYICHDVLSGATDISTYWQLPFDSDKRTSPEKDLIEEFRHHFQTAIKLRAPDEVPYGAYLSGGLDSAAIVSTMATLQKAPFEVFSIGFDNDQYDESAYAKFLARQLELPQHVVRIGKGDLKDTFPASVWQSEIPVLNTHGAAKRLLAQEAGKHCKVVLTGEGADELLYGYGMFDHLKRQENRGNKSLTGTKDSQLSVLRGSLSGKLQQYDNVTDFFGAYPYAMQRFFFLRRISQLLLRGQYRRNSATWDWKTVIPQHLDMTRFKGLNSLEATLEFHLHTDFPAYLLNYLGDRQEMSAGVEGRVPFLDHELVEFACTLPEDMKLRGATGKYILREMLRGQLDERLCDRPKQVFYAPAFESIDFFANPDFYKPFIGSAAFEAAGIFNPLFFSMLTRLIRLIPAKNKLVPVAESVAVFVLSFQMLHEFFIRDFDTWQQHFAPVDPNLEVKTHDASLIYP